MATAIASGLPPKVDPCEPTVIPFRGFRRRQAGANRKAAAKRFRERHDIRRNPTAFIGKHLAGARDTRLHFVEHEEQIMLIAQLAQGTQEIRAATRTPPSPWIGSSGFPRFQDRWRA